MMMMMMVGLGVQRYERPNPLHKSLQQFPRNGEGGQNLGAERTNEKK
jgi:hypothetical protein